MRFKHGAKAKKHDNHNCHAFCYLNIRKGEVRFS